MNWYVCRNCNSARTSTLYWLLSIAEQNILETAHETFVSIPRIPLVVPVYFPAAPTQTHHIFSLTASLTCFEPISIHFPSISTGLAEDLKDDDIHPGPFGGWNRKTALHAARRLDDWPGMPPDQWPISGPRNTPDEISKPAYIMVWLVVSLFFIEKNLNNTLHSGW